jgi:hypothetical protein
MSVRSQVAAIGLIVLVGIVGFWIYKHRHPSVTAQGPLQNASCRPGEDCTGKGATCVTAGYGKVFLSNKSHPIYCNNLGSTEGGAGECGRTGDPRMEIGFPTNGPYHANTPVPVNISVVLGSGDAIVHEQDGSLAQGGRIDWGDGLGPRDYPQINIGAPFSTTHVYPNAIGSTTIQVMAWTQFKYQAGRESGSYESCVDKTVTLTIVP